MDFSNLKSLSIPEGDVKEISVGGTVIWKSGYTNLVPISTESDGKTIYNGGLGYKNGYRVRSSGVEGTQGDATCTGFIQVKGGDVIGIGGAQHGTNSTSNAINVYDASYTNKGQVTESYIDHGYGIFADGKISNWNKGVLRDGVYYWTVPNGQNISYIRVTARMYGQGNNMIVTVNEEIE